MRKFMSDSGRVFLDTKNGLTDLGEIRNESRFYLGLMH